MIPNAAGNPPPESDVKPDLTACDRHVLFVGAMSWEKQVDHVIRAVAALTNVGLVCVGDGPESARLNHLGHHLLGDRFRSVGPVTDPYPFYRHCDVLVLASKTEGQPACILEAASVGTPAVAYGVGGIPEMIVDGRTGRLVAPSATESLSQAIAWALREHDRMACRVRLEVFEPRSMARVAKEWAAYLNRQRASSH